MRSTGSWLGRRRLPLLTILERLTQRFEQCFHALHRHLGEDAAAQVEDMSPLACEGVDVAACIRPNNVRRSEQRARIQVALERNAPTDALNGLGRRDAPVEANDIGPAVREGLQEMGAI